jgi:hypothetical protein
MFVIFSTFNSFILFTCREIALLFGISEATCLKFIGKVLALICHLSPEYIKWPVGIRAQQVSTGFEDLSGIPGVLGAIDGSHIPIKCPREHHECYYNRNFFYSVILQGVCDHEMAFTDTYIGWAGSSHDSAVFNASELSSESAAERLFPGNTHLLGDKAYTLSPTMLTPYKEGRALNN